ncbi:hypothetical protein L596_028614 [Steinernema carpocapsae]|uniref:Uncharacterized protein n=1 Tax=Steinernema carpocapsae TaxID=34508 RepID=A0A4U5LZX0_STECR|nr:hypothetical protein L596_028614 [Steinernema carpocapsae]
MSAKKKSQLQAIKDHKVALKYRQQLRDESLQQIREEAGNLLETWRVAMREDTKQAETWKETLNFEVDNTMAYINKLDEALDSMENQSLPALEIDEDAILARAKATVAELMALYRPEEELSQLEAKFEEMARNLGACKELEELQEKILSGYREEVEKLQEEKRKLERKLEEMKERSEEKEVRLVADKILLERKEQKAEEELEKIRKKRLELEKEDEMREEGMRETEAMIKDLKNEVEMLKKTAEKLKFEPENK